MAELFIPSRGCVYIAIGHGSAGFYSLEPPLFGRVDAPILLDGVDSSDQDIVFPVTTLDEKKYLYCMGEDFGNITIGGFALLGKADQGGQSFRDLVGYFTDHRINKELTPITVSFPGSIYQKVYLTGLVIARPDPDFHIQPFQFRGIVAEPKHP